VRRGELAYCLLALGQPLEHGAPGVIAERTENEVESQLSMFNHVVEYRGRSLIVNSFVECSPECCAAGAGASYLTRLEGTPPMPDDVTNALHEIAELLRQRVEQTADMAKRSEERFAGIRRRERTVPDFAAIESKHETEAAAHREESAQRRAEDIEFRERLLKAIEDQNILLRAIVDRAAPPT
jgi:hypothetical protein